MSPLHQPPKGKIKDDPQQYLDMQPLDLLNRDVVWIDFETGGTRCRYHSPLSFAMIRTRGMDIIDQWITNIRQEPLVVTAGAMKVTGIDLTEEGLNFVQFYQAYTKIINQWFYEDEHGQWIKASRHNMPLFGGQNIAFDRPWLQWILNAHRSDPECFERSWDGLYYHGLDLMRLATTCARMGVFKPYPDLKLASICKVLEIPAPEEGFHDALGDVKQTFWAYWVLEDRLRRAMPGIPYTGCLSCTPWKKCQDHIVQLPGGNNDSN
jgi:exonuclease I